MTVSPRRGPRASGRRMKDVPPMPRARLLPLLAAWLLGPALTPASAQAQPSAEQLRFFEAKVRPILAEACYRCHGPDKKRGGLRLDSPSAMLQGGDSGPALVPGK